jgi:hypothetical protein
MEPRNRFRGIDSANLCSLEAGTTNRVVLLARQAGNRFLGSLKVYKHGLWLHRLAESISRNRFLGSINVYKYGLWKENTGRAIDASRKKYCGKKI